MDIPDVRRETRYGMPQADQVIFTGKYTGDLCHLWTSFLF